MQEYTPYTRQRPDRHPYQIGCLVGIAFVSFSQIAIGLSPDSALWEAIDVDGLIAMNLCFIIGSILSLVGALLNREKDDIRLSLRCGIAGQFAICVASTFYAGIIVTITKDPYWLSVLSGGLTAGIAYASGHRLFQQWRALRWTNRAVKVVTNLEEKGYNIPPRIEDGD